MCQDTRCTLAGPHDLVCVRCLQFADPALGRRPHRVTCGKRKYCFGCSRESRNFSRLKMRAHQRRVGAPVWKLQGYASLTKWRRAHRREIARWREKRRRRMCEQCVTAVNAGSVAKRGRIAAPKVQAALPRLHQGQERQG
jgi:hypothetical protein